MNEETTQLQYMNFIFDGMNELVASMDKNFNFTYFNKSYKTEFERIFLVPELKIGDNILEKMSHLPEEQENAKSIWSRAFNVIFEVFTDLQSLTIDKDINLWMKCEKYKKVNIYVDQQRYKQILINLISNAIKYNKCGGQVQIQSRIENNMLIIDVVDTGIGISKENLEKIGIPFERLGKEASNIQGSGLGISIVKMLTTIMNGYFHIESEVGKGSVFSIGFTISNDLKSENSPLNNKNEQMDEIVVSSFAGKIVYVEDNEFNLMLMDKVMKRYFPKAQYTFKQDGIEGLNIIRETMPDIALLDINLSSMNGLDILRTIRGSNLNVKVMMISADVTENIEKKCLNLGADGYISKPLAIPVFAKKMNELIEK